MRILLTGGGGYIGSELVPLLLGEGHELTVVDNFMHGQASLLDCCADPKLTIVRADVRDDRVMSQLVPNADAVLPLACLTGAPICVRESVASQAINHDAVERISDLMSPRQLMVFPSTNSGYGVGEAGLHCDEETPLRPISP